MNFLEALISLLALFVIFSIILGGINNYDKILTSAKENFDTKQQVINCASLIESYYSNNATIGLTTNCFEKDGKVVFRNNDFISTKNVIIKIKKETNLEVEKNDHYVQ